MYVRGAVECRFTNKCENPAFFEVFGLFWGSGELLRSAMAKTLGLMLRAPWF